MALSRAYKIFVGSYIHLVVKNIKGSGPNRTIANLHIGGYLLDEDKTFYYIGNNTGEVSGAVTKDSIAAILMANEEEDLMGEIDVPDNQEVQ